MRHKSPSPGMVSALVSLGLRNLLREQMGDAGLQALLQQVLVSPLPLPPGALGDGPPPDMAALTDAFMDPKLTCAQEIPELIMVAILHAATTMTGLSMEALMFEFGRNWMPWALEQAGYDKCCIRQVSRSFIGFARCLNQLLLQICIILGSHRPLGVTETQITHVTHTSFVIGVIGDDEAAILHSTLHLFVYKGMLQWAAEALFGQQITFSPLESVMLPSGRLHRSSHVSVSPQVVCSPPEVPAPTAELPPPALPADATAAPSANPGVLGVAPDTFDKLFPFCFTMDLECRVLQAGAGLKRLLPALAQPGVHVSQVFELRLPPTQWSLECLAGVIDNAMCERVVLKTEQGMVDLCGGLHRLPHFHAAGAEGSSLTAGEDVLMFMGSPLLTSVDELGDLDLFLSDFPPHDLTAEQVMLAASKHELAAAALQKAQQSNDELKRTLAETLAKQEEQAGRTQLNTDSAGHLLLRLLDGLLAGEQASTQDVLEARNALLRGGDSVWRPLQLNWSEMGDGDKEVKQALARLLGTGPMRDSLEEVQCYDLLPQGLPSRGGPSTPGVRPPIIKPNLSAKQSASGQRSSTDSVRILAMKRSAGGAAAGGNAQGPMEGSLGLEQGQQQQQQQQQRRQRSWRRMLKSMCMFSPERDDTPTHSEQAGRDALAPARSVTSGTFSTNLITSDSGLAGGGQMGPPGENVTEQFKEASAARGNNVINMQFSETQEILDTYLCSSTHGHESGIVSSGNQVVVTKDAKASAAMVALLMQPGDEVSAVLRQVDEWQFDSFALDRVTGGKPLSYLAFHLMSRMGLIKSLRLDANKLAGYLMRVEEGYGNNPYHGRIHAADVLRSFHVILHSGGVLATVTKHADATAAVQTLQPESEGLDDGNALQLFTCYMAAVVHDYEHRGVNNDFLIRSSDALALRYNDISPLENHHVAAAFTLMHQPAFAFMPAVTKQMQTALRKDVIELVLATDMKQHFALTSNFTLKLGTFRRHSTKRASRPGCDALPGAHLEPKQSGVTNGDNATTKTAGSHCGHSSGSHTEVWDKETQMLVYKMALKAADLGHLTSRTEVHKTWVARLEEEMFRQGDQERQLGQPISPLMDRTKSGIQKSQCGFFKVVAQPMYTAFAHALPQAASLVSNLQRNLEYWRLVEASASTA